MIEIKRHNGPVLVSLQDYPEGALVHYELMSEHYVKLSFTLSEPIYLKVGDYIECEFGKFSLLQPYRPTYNVETDAFDYEVQLDAYYMQFKNKLCKYLPYSTSSEASFKLTANVSTHLSVVLSNINALCERDSFYLYNGKQYTFSIINLPADKAEAYKYIDYNQFDIISAFNKIAETFECEWWIDANVIYFGKCEIGEPVDFELGANVESMSSSESSSEYATRLIAFGSEKNLPANYRESESADITKDGVVQRRLMLPISLCPNGYVEDTGISEQEAVEAIYVNEDIYPRTQCKVSEVLTYTSQVENEDGTTSEWTFYRLKDGSGFVFSTDMILENETLHMQFTSGKLNGMDFECQYNDTEKYYEVVVNEDYGRKLPDTILKPEVDDTFVLYNWDATKIEGTGIIEAAEKELYDNALLKLAEMKKDPNTYDCTMYSDWYSKYIETSSSLSYSIGQKVNLINLGYFANGRESRIIGFEIKLDIPYDNPKYIVGEAAAYSKTREMQSKLDSLTYNGISYISKGTGTGGSSVYVIGSSDSTVPSDYNVYSAKRSDAQYLRKDKEDTARGVVTFLRQSQFNEGMQIGDTFVPGLVGLGGRFDSRGYGELRGLRLWEWLEVPELRMNRVTVNIGLGIRSVGGGIIESVSIDTTTDSEGVEVEGTTGSVHLKLEDGEYGAIEEGDLCMGLWHDLGGGNSTENTDNHKGSFTMRGFKTVYFRISEIPAKDENGKDNTDQHYFKYVLRPSSDGGNRVHPFAMMHFAQRGNIEDTERQAFVFETTKYELKLANVCTWEFQDSYTYSISGILDGFTMQQVGSDGNTYTKHFEGYGNVFGHAYIYGTIDQFERVAITMQIDTQGMRDLAYGESVLLTCKLFKGYVDVTERATRWEILRDSCDEAEDAAWKVKDKVKAFNGSMTISFSKEDNDLSLSQPVTVFTIKAYQQEEEIAETILSI